MNLGLPSMVGKWQRERRPGIGRHGKTGPSLVGGLPTEKAARMSNKEGLGNGVVGKVGCRVLSSAVEV